MYQYISKKEEDTICFASKLASVLQKGDLIWLSGDLGTGKTKFTQGILRHFAMEDQISSPYLKSILSINLLICLLL